MVMESGEIAEQLKDAAYWGSGTSYDVLGNYPELVAYTPTSLQKVRPLSLTMREIVCISPFNPVHPIFSEPGLISRGTKHNRSIAIQHPGEQVISEVFKGDNLGNRTNEITDNTLQRITHKELPFGLELNLAILQFSNNVDFHRDSISRFGQLADAGLPLAARKIDEIAGVSVRSFIKENYLINKRDKLLEIWNMFCFTKALLEGEKNAYYPTNDIAQLFFDQLGFVPAQFIYLLEGYDIRATDLYSALLFPEAIPGLLDDPLYSKLGKKNSGYFIGGPDALRRGGGNYDNVVRSVIGVLNKSYSVEIPLPDYKITPSNYCSAIEEIRNSTPRKVSDDVMNIIVTNLARGAALGHACESTFSAKPREGGALIGRNVALGWRSSQDKLMDRTGRINIGDLMTHRYFNKGDDRETRKFYVSKDIKEMLTTIACFTRFFAPASYTYVYELAVSRYQQYLEKANAANTTRSLAMTSMTGKDMVAFARVLGLC